MKNKNFLLIMLICLSSISFARTGAKYLIICPDNFVSAVQPLADWKTKKGVKALIAPLSVTGNTAAQIKTYIQNAYDTWDIRPEYILLAGLSSVLPASGSSDDYYANMDAGYQIELSIGRLPCSTIDQINNIVNKTLKYERNPFIDDPSWFLKGMTIVREDYSAYPPTSYPDTYYWENARYCITQWLHNGYVHIDSLSKNLGHSSTNIINGINDGRAYVIFRGQSTTNWWSPFQVDPENTTNGYKLPVIVSGTCTTMSLSSASYLGNMFINAGSTINPKGAVGFFASTRTYSGSGLAQQRGIVAVGFYQALFAEQIYTMGDAAKRAKFLLDSIRPPGFSQDRYDEWNLFGDPELNLWTNAPKRFVVIYDSLIPLSQNNILITVQGENGQPIPNALVCVKMDTSLYVWGNTNSQGQIQLPIHSETVGIMDITVTAHNFIPFEGTARFIPSNAPFIVFNSVVINDSLGNNDGKINPGETVKLQIYLRNDGAVTANNVYACLRTSDALITIIDSVCPFGTIATGQTTSSQGYYKFYLNPNAQHNHQINFQLLIQDDQSRTWNQQFNALIYAGKLNFSSSFINDSFPSGNSSTRLGPGESARITASLANVGENLQNVFGLLRSESQYIVITDSLANYGNILSGQTGNNYLDQFAVSASPALPKNYPINFSVLLTGQGETYTYHDNINFSIITETGTITDPTGPDDYGYWAYDNTDTLSGRAPVYNWFEIGPSGPGSLIDSITNRDAAVVTLSLPFTFKYYGQNYDSISVCCNGFLAMGRTNYRLATNTPIPDTGGPSAMISPFWCDLNANENTNPPGAGDIYQYFDASNHRWIVEFYGVAHYGQTNVRETFQIILFDPVYYPTQTGDGEIIYMYNTVANATVTTVGIENQNETYGIQYEYNNNYNSTAAQLINGCAVKFTTLSPTNLQRPWIVLTQGIINDSIGGNNNGIPEPNETIRFISYIKNRGTVPAQNVQLILRSLNGNAIVNDSVRGFGTISQGEEVNNQLNPFVFAVASSPSGNNLNFNLSINADNYSTIDYFSFLLIPYPGIDIEKITQQYNYLILKQNRPNPFRLMTTLEYSIPNSQHVELKIFNTSGRLVRILISQTQSAGVYKINWDGKDQTNRYVSQGIYYYTLTSSNNTNLVRKMVLY